MKIEFDASKAIVNFRKHGVSFAEAETVFYDPNALCSEDPDAFGESRWILVGLDLHLRLLTVIYTLREEQIRIISARRATRKEANYYA